MTTLSTDVREMYPSWENISVAYVFVCVCMCLYVCMSTCVSSGGAGPGARFVDAGSVNNG